MNVLSGIARAQRRLPCHRSSSSIASILKEVQAGTLSVSDAESRIAKNEHQQTTSSTSESSTSRPTDGALDSFANLDHGRTKRAGFPEAIFAAGKTAPQVASILDDMAKHVNAAVASNDASGVAEKAILATRVDKDLYNEISSIPLQNGTIIYHEIANLISMKASSLDDDSLVGKAVGNEDNNIAEKNTVVVACAGTTDLPVAEEASITLEAAGCKVERIYDVGVAGLHRIINVLPRLRNPNVRCVIVCAGMDGALPSVVAGLVTVPVVAVPTSIGYGACFGGVSAMLTMLNSCAPGVGVVNIDNGFGAAALAFKFVNN